MKRAIRLRGAAGKTRTETYMGQEHLVVPVVGLVEGVIWAVNAETPELVLAEDMAIAPAGWNGRPCFVDHPADEDENKISGNNPEALENLAFGTLFHANSGDDVLQTKKLKFEAWLNKAKAVDVPGAEDIIRRLEAEDPDDIVEISVGVFVRAEEVKGEYDGIKYFGIWRNIVPDHLALLPAGVKGACSVEMGCGAPRAASVHLVTERGLERIGDENMTVPNKDKRSLRDRLVDLMPSLKLRTNAGEDGSISDGELRNRLDSAIRAVEPGYYWIDDVFPEQSLVVYTVAPEEKWEMYQRSYALDANNNVTLNDDRVVVEPTLTYTPTGTTSDEPVTAAAASSCGCGSTTNGGNMKKEQRIAALIAASKGRYVETDKTWLMQVPDERLTALEQNSDAGPKGDPIPGAPTGDTGSQRNDPPPPAPAQPRNDPPPPAERRDNAVPRTAEEFLGTLPADVADSVRQGMRIAEQRKAASIKALKDTGRCKLTDAELNGRTQDQLDQLVELAGVRMTPQAVDFSGQAPRAAEQHNESNEPPKAPSFYDAVRANAANQK